MQYVLRRADSCLIHAQRLAEWCGHGPVLEEDFALTNLALDLFGQASALLTLAGPLAATPGSRPGTKTRWRFCAVSSSSSI